MIRLSKLHTTEPTHVAMDTSLHQREESQQVEYETRTHDIYSPALNPYPVLAKIRLVTGESSSQRGGERREDVDEFSASPRSTTHARGRTHTAIFYSKTAVIVTGSAIGGPSIRPNMGFLFQTTPYFGVSVYNFYVANTKFTIQLDELEYQEYIFFLLPSPFLTSHYVHFLNLVF